MKDEKAKEKALYTVITDAVHKARNEWSGYDEEEQGVEKLIEKGLQMLEFANQSNQQPTKTVEERALELYPVRMVEREIPKHVGQPFVYEEDDNEAARKAYIKGATDNQNK